jgi:CysZ protein
MNKIGLALKQSLQACLDIRILLLLFTPFFLAVIVGLVLFFTLGTWWIATATSGVEHSEFMRYIAERWSGFGNDAVSSISYVLVVVVAILVILPISYWVAIVVVSLVLLPFILKILEQKDFKGIEKKRGGNFAYSLWNTLKVSVIYILGLMVTLPLWFFPGFAVVMPILLSSYLNKNLFVYDVLEEYASREERKQIETENRGNLYLLGMILGFLNYIPLAFVVAPTFASLAYSYFCLNALKDMRENKP